MVHFSIFGGHEGRLNPGRAIYVSVFGGTTLTRPALAHVLAEQRQRGGVDRASWGYFFFNLFGGATIRWPTLAEEYAALVDALRARALSLEEWDRAVGRVGELAPLRFASFTLFGGLETDALPKEDNELDELSLQRHTGTLPQASLEQLMVAIGQTGPARLAAVRQAAAMALKAG